MNTASKWKNGIYKHTEWDSPVILKQACEIVSPADQVQFLGSCWMQSYYKLN